MRRFLFFLAVTAACAASPLLYAQARPQFRPAVLGSGPTSLARSIDAQALYDAGQRTGAVMFSAHVLKDGQLVDAHTYHPAPDSDKLELEVLRKVSQARVAPAIYESQPVEVILTGTVSFSVTDDKPQIAIFLNQDPKELKDARDFIAPQVVFGGPSKFEGTHYPPSASVVPLSGLVSAAVKIDAKGNLNGFDVIAEDPPLLGFGLSAIRDFSGAKFIPAFRDGDPVECDTVLPIFYPIG